MSLPGKVALVTGGGRGVGAATAQLLAERGAPVVINYFSNTTAAEEIVQAIRAKGGEACAVQADVRDAMQQEIQDAGGYQRAAEILLQVVQGHL
jgi:3-oxoacyl-[acyl-carrier protein] reductase